MKIRDLPPEKLDRLAEIVARHQRFYRRLLARIDGLGIDPQDRVRMEVIQALNGVHAVGVEVHYARVGTGVG